MKPNFEYWSSSTRDAELLGGYFFPIMSQGDGEFRIRTYDIATNDLADLIEEVRRATYLAFTKSGQTGSHLTVVDAEFSLADIGLELSASGQPLTRQMVYENLADLKGTEWRYGAFELLSAVRESRHPTKLPKRQFFSEDIVDLATQGADAQGNKLFKRAATVTRAFRRVVHAPERPERPGEYYFNIWVVDDPTNVLEGFGFINPYLLEFANEHIKLPSEVWALGEPILRARVIKGLDKLPISNARVVGNLVDIETGEPIAGHIKCQLAPSYDMPPHVDFVVPREAIKHELKPLDDHWPNWAIAGLEPQGPKALFGDRQTINNHPFMISRPTLRNDMNDEAAKAFNELANGELMRDIDATTVDEFDAPFVWNRESYNRMLRWSAMAWRAHNMDYRDSPWLSERLGLQWSQSLGWSDRAQQTRASRSTWERTLKIPIRCAMRMQIISEDSFNLVRDLQHAGSGLPDPNHLEVPRGVMRQGFRDLPVMVVNSVDYTDILVPSHGGSDQDDFYLVLQCEIKGVKSYLVFRNPNARGEYSVWNFFEGDKVWEHETSTHKIVTFPKITKTRWPTQVLEALKTGETKYLELPSSIDPTLTPEDDRKAVMQEQERILAQLKEDGIPVDPLLVLRLGNAGGDLPRQTDPDKLPIFADSKGVLAKVIGEYIQRVRRYTAQLPIPSYLEELGNNVLLPQAKQFLQAARYQMYATQQAGGEMSDMVKSESIVLMRFIKQHDHPAFHAQAIMALWYACRTTPRSTGGFNDQPIFGTDIFCEDIEVRLPFLVPTGGKQGLVLDAMPQVLMSHWHLLDALMYFGIAHEPVMPDKVRNKPFIKYMGSKIWSVACTSCGTGYLGLSLDDLIRFHHVKGVCRECRQNAEIIR